MEENNKNVEDELLSKASAEALREFIKEQAVNDVQLQRKLNKWLYRNYGKEVMSPEILIARVRSLFCDEIRKDEQYPWFEIIDYDWYYVVTEMKDILNDLRELINRGGTSAGVEPIFEFFRILQKIWRDEGDDLDGNEDSEAWLLEEACENCVSMLCEWAQTPGVTDADRYRMLDEYRAICQACPSDEAWMYILKNCYIDIKVAVLPPEEAYKEIQDLYTSGNRDQQIVAHKIKLCKQLGRPEEAEKTIWENVRYLELVQNELHRLCELGRLNDALKLAEESIRVNGGNKTTLHDKLDIVQQLKYTPAIIDTLFRIAVLGNSDLQDYHNLKALVPVNEWHSFYTRIVDQLRRRDQFEYLAAVYKEENELDALYKLIKSAAFDQLSLIRKYLPILPAKYHAELVKIGINIFQDETKSTAPREQYREFANRLKSFSKLPGAFQPVEDFLLFLRTTYKRRSAMMEELNKVFPTY